ncbi:MAG TPA: hypothetical protein VGK20_01575 [Candidatus Binatia bacterium]
MSEPRPYQSPARRRRSRRDRVHRILATRIAAKRTSTGRFVGSLGNSICQCCGDLVVVDLREEAHAGGVRRDTCQSCRASGNVAAGRRFCELCGRDSDTEPIELVGEICAGCARSVHPGRLVGALAINARRRFVDRFCATREDLLRLDAILEDERWLDESALADPHAVQRGYRRLVRRVTAIRHELGVAWSPPPPPDASAPVAARRLDVLVARALRAPVDIFARNALLASSRQDQLALIDEVQALARGSTSTVAVEEITALEDEHVWEVLRLCDRLGRSVYAVVRRDLARGTVGEHGVERCEETRTLWAIVPSWNALQVTVGNEVHGNANAAGDGDPTNFAAPPAPTLQ